MRMTSKGQVTIPKDVRERLGIAPGGEVGFREDGGQIVIEALKPEADEDQAERMVRVLTAFGRDAKKLPMTDKELMALTREPADGGDAD